MRKGFDGLAAMVQTALVANPFCGHALRLPRKRVDILKVLWFDGQGLMHRLAHAGAHARALARGLIPPATQIPVEL